MVKVVLLDYVFQTSFRYFIDFFSFKKPFNRFYLYICLLFVGAKLQSFYKAPNILQSFFEENTKYFISD